MILDVDIRKFFTPKAIARLIEQAPPLELPIRNTVFTQSKQHSLSVIGFDEIENAIGNVPVVRRGSTAVPVSGGARGIRYIEPQPVEVSDFVTAAEINNWRVLSAQGLEAAINGKLNKLQNVCRKTTEALCAQALTGKISYQMKTDAGMDTYEVDFGETLSYTPNVAWNSTEAKVKDIFQALSEIDGLIQKEGWGGKYIILCGKKAFYAAVGVADTSAAQKSPLTVRIEEQGTLDIAGYRLKLINTSYTGADGKAVPTIAENKICMISLSAPHTLFYCAIDDVDAGLVALPFYASTEVKRNPSGIEIVGKSKPLPAPVVRAICWAEVTE